MLVSEQSYHDLCKEIDVLVNRIDDLKKERKIIIKILAPKGIKITYLSSERVQDSRKLKTFKEMADRLIEIEIKLPHLLEILKEKERTKRKMEERLSEFQGLDYQVVHMRMKGLSLIEIADELGYSYSWIKKISMRAKKGTRKEPRG